MKKKKTLYPQDIVKNNPRADRDAADGWDDDAIEQEKKRTLYDAATRRTKIADKILEIYRRTPYQSSRGITYRTTASGNRVAWDEPHPDMEDEINDRINRLMKQRELAKQQRISRERLKQKNAVPKKAGKPMYERQILEEDFNKAISLLRNAYLSGRVMRFKDWISTMEHILDEL